MNKIVYGKDGKTKLCKATYYDNGSLKVFRTYQDGSQTSETTYFENGHPRKGVYYQPDGSKTTEWAYYESNSKIKTWIVFQKDGVTKSMEWTYYEDGHT